MLTRRIGAAARVALMLLGAIAIALVSVQPPFPLAAAERLSGSPDPNRRLRERLRRTLDGGGDP